MEEATLEEEVQASIQFETDKAMALADEISVEYERVKESEKVHQAKREKAFALVAPPPSSTNSRSQVCPPRIRKVTSLIPQAGCT